MANLNPLQALQSRDNLIFANQSTLDSSQNLSDQGLTSFPDELRAAKQQSQNPTQDTPRTEARNTQATEEKPQNLPPSTDQAQQDAANIAAPQTNSQAEAPQANAQTPSEAPAPQGVDQATLGQVEVALAVEAKAATASETLAVVDTALSAVLADGVAQQAGNQEIAAATLNAQNQAAIAKAAADAAALQAGAVAAAAVTADAQVTVVDPSITTVATEVAVLTDSLQTQDTQTDVVATDVAVDANPIAIANVVQVAVAPVVQVAQAVAADTGTSTVEVAQVAAANANAATTQTIANTQSDNVAAQTTLENPVDSGNAQAFAATLNQAAANVSSAPVQAQTSSARVESVKINPGQAVQVSSTVAAQVQANTEQVAANASAGAQELPLDQVVIQKIELPTTSTQTAVNVAATPAVQNAVQAVSSSSDTAAIDQAASVNTAATIAKPADQAVAQSAPKPVNLPTVEEGEFSKQVRTQNAESFVAATAVTKQERSIRVVEKDDSLAQASNNGINATDAKQTSFISTLNQEVKLTQTTTVKLEPQNASLATGPLNAEVMRVLKEGGGRVVMEVTPPDQGTIRIDLRLDNQGRAIVVVDGASDSTRARLEQGSSQLKEQLAQMGLSLSLDMRQHSDNAGQPQFMAEGIAFSNGGNSSTAAANADVAAGILSSAIPAADGRINLYA
ncbi:flagellar hook-length control protein FliK [Polynucleobacter sp. AP-Kolm-20A-A1]|uniref:flagellar hook-length control protein FliK n=1 Tax=Polynucleobacter sp. AP-Kolm-20A-A1 TaxID=2081041 RepID=UPI001BFE63C7|nr:flagellar hook-length control protein FliK [Polynucleobacter sp. AP-Kolm-20A-A1]QWE19942.1 flagellar hook-length control protein FliK [Polynucleobacter sp. AP-Kolm-20A-A1]